MARQTTKNDRLSYGAAEPQALLAEAGEIDFGLADQAFQLLARAGARVQFNTLAECRERVGAYLNGAALDGVGLLFDTRAIKLRQRFAQDPQPAGGIGFEHGDNLRHQFRIAGEGQVLKSLRQFPSCTGRIDFQGRRYHPASVLRSNPYLSKLSIVNMVWEQRSPQSRSKVEQRDIN
ncbi:hypothetical protein SBA3_1980043 [Candidatus Sulfopaludibacter sp. SbA3]|nr:hypothetical protein SBA3_1980043 [Candidatus Sulfopaludibacter sp. SbA3]